MNMKTYLAVLIALSLFGTTRLRGQDNVNQSKSEHDSTITTIYYERVIPSSRGLDTAGAPSDFVPVDKEPTIIYSQKPDYPPAALKNRVEGRVILKIWVDKNGDSRKAVVLKSDDDVFNEPSIAAAMAYKFTPAIQGKNPVDVWVVIAFTFRLNDYKGRLGDTLSEASQELQQIVNSLRFDEKLLESVGGDSAKYNEAINDYLKALRIYNGSNLQSASDSAYAKEMLKQAELYLEQIKEIEEKQM